MQAWLQAIFHYAQLEQLNSRWVSELPLLLLFPALFLLEAHTSGWRESSLLIFFRRDRSGWWELAFFAAQVSGIRKVLANLFFFGLIAYIGFAMGDFTFGLLKGSSPWIRVPMAVLLFDFLQYWNHRMRHVNNWLWLVHEFHHSSTRVNMLTSYRVHPIDNIIYILTIIIPFQLLLGLDLLNSFSITLFSAIPGLYSHARIDYDFGWIGRYLLVTPRFHHLHHAINAKKFSNYGHAFVFWDRIFGTFTSPEISIVEIDQGIEDNYYEYASPVRAFFRPVLDFYLYPFRRANAVFSRIFPERSP
jgi:sterol desaturase/sphingolipid hydroxylase (fatty acid hydroxylase superfamily)